MTYSDALDQVVREIRQRVTRIESRICRIGDALDISLRNPKEGMRVVSVSAEAVELSIDCCDTALSELISFVEKSSDSAVSKQSIDNSTASAETESTLIPDRKSVV